jgi:hypothetical protein
MCPGHWKGCGEKNALEVWFLVVLRNELVGLYRKNHGVPNKQAEVVELEVV